MPGPMTKERLQKYRSIKKEYRQIQGLLDEIEAQVYSPAQPQMTGMPGARSAESGSAQERRSDRTRELRDRYRAKLDELAAEQLAIEEAIETLDPDARLVLRHHYITGYKWEEVCNLIPCSWRTVHRIHSRALQQLAKIEKAPED
ncbi:MAG: hypothetical protein J6V15_03865 [Clostridia bacterium]|nr:hypothetical protein [Clostridia bacterium]